MFISDDDEMEDMEDDDDDDEDDDDDDNDMDEDEEDDEDDEDEVNLDMTEEVGIQFGSDIIYSMNYIYGLTSDLSI